MDKADVSFLYKSGNMCNTGFNENITLNDGKTYNAQMISVEKGTVPGFPFVVEVTSPTNKRVSIEGVMHEKKQNEWAGIPLVNGRRNV